MSLFGDNKSIVITFLLINISLSVEKSNSHISKVMSAKVYITNRNGIGTGLSYYQFRATSNYTIDLSKIT